MPGHTETNASLRNKNFFLKYQAYFQRVKSKFNFQVMGPVEEIHCFVLKKRCVKIVKVLNKKN